MNGIFRKVLNTVRVVLREFMNYGVGWTIGVSVVKFVSNYFEVSGFSNLYGLWSDKMVVEATTLSRIELVLSLVIGYFTMKYVNKFIHPYVEKMFNKVEEQI